MPTGDGSLTDILGILAVLVLVAANGFFVAAEFSMVAVRRSRVTQLVAAGRRNAKALQRAISQLDANLAAVDRPRRVRYAQVSSDLFTALGVPPRAGRTIRAEETLPGADPVIVLSEEIWRSAFAADPGLVGGTVDVNGRRRTVIGIMPSGFDVFDQGVEVWLPLSIDPANRSNRGNHYLYLVGRLARGVTMVQSRNEMETLLAQWPLASQPARREKRTSPERSA